MATSICLGSQWFVSTNGSGNGRLGSPWSLQTALTNSSIQPGDTVWLRGGTYTGVISNGFTVLLCGIPNLRITLRNYNHEQATLDVNGGMFYMGTAGSVCSNLWVWGLEFIDTKKGSRPSPAGCISGGGDDNGNWIINCLIHDVCIGIGRGPNIYGNVMWNCGHDNGNEHAIYTQNQGPTPLIIEDNLIGYSSAFGIHCYSGGSGPLNNISITRNSVWASGWPGGSPKADILLGGAMPITACEISSNNCVFAQRSIQFGQSGITNSDLIVRGNYGIGFPWGFYITDCFTNLIVTNNVMANSYSGSTIYFSSLTNAPFFGTQTWDFNSYFLGEPYLNGGEPWWVNSLVAINGLVTTNLSGWQQIINGESHSSYTSNMMPNRVAIQANLFEPKRANITVWNWSGMTSTNVDVSSVLSPGDSYRLMNAMNYFSGPVASGIYTGGSITVPLTNHILSPFLYWTPPTTNIYNVSTNFAAFVVIGSSPSAPSGPPTNVHIVPH